MEAQQEPMGRHGFLTTSDCLTPQGGPSLRNRYPKKTVKQTLLVINISDDLVPPKNKKQKRSNSCHVVQLLLQLPRYHICLTNWEQHRHSVNVWVQCRTPDAQGKVQDTAVSAFQSTATTFSTCRWNSPKLNNIEKESHFNYMDVLSAAVTAAVTE